MVLKYIFVTGFVLSTLVSLGQIQSNIYKEYCENPKNSLLIDFSTVGYAFGKESFEYPKEIVNVADRGVVPNTDEDLTSKVQELINEVGKEGGGILYFPEGKYLFNTNPNEVEFLKIDYDNIVIRGAGDAKTVFYNATSLLQDEPNPWISPALIRFGYGIQGTDYFWGAAPLKAKYAHPEKDEDVNWQTKETIYEAEIIAQVTHDAPQGTRNLHVTDASEIVAGDVVLLVMYNTNNSDKLIKKILNYSDVELTNDLVAANRAAKEGVASFQALVEIERVVSSNEIVLCQPLRMDIEMEFLPAIAQAPMVRNVGVENLRFDSAWEGGYKHHANREVDYGWNAINFCRVAHGWMKNVSINNFTNPIYLQDSRNVTVDSIKITGHWGHSGVKLYAHAADNLIQNIAIETNFTHVLSGEGNVSGNVFRKIDLNKQTKGEGDFDFHGFSHYTYAPPTYNLFEQITGLRIISGGGAKENFPHTGKGNVWWNIESTDIGGEKELFFHWIWSKENRTDHHVSYPASIVVGFGADDGTIVIDGSDKDRQNRLITVEALNQKVLPHSLYEAQKGEK